MMVRVLPADRQPLFNQALEALFSEDGRYQVVGPCYRQEDVLQAVRLLQPELLLVDSEAALSGTPTVIERALAERQGLKVLVLAHKMDLRIVLDAVAAGALGVVLKTSLPATVASAVESVLSDRVPEQGTTVSRLFRQLADAQHWITASPVNRLSSRGVRCWSCSGGAGATRRSGVPCTSARTRSAPTSRTSSRSLGCIPVWRPRPSPLSTRAS